jgi:hypothetical protein
MAFWIKAGLRTEHSGHKGSNRKSGFWGLRADAKLESKVARRTQDKIAVKKGLEKGDDSNV